MKRYRQTARLLAWGLLLMLPDSLQAQVTPPEPWEFTATLSTYWYPEEDVDWVPLFSADRDLLHLEGRYNYEDERTVSLFAGWLFPLDGSVSAGLTPMLGAVLGNSKGIAPGLEIDIAWWRIELYAEMEYLISLDGPEYDFFYSWTEAAVHPAEWFGVGLVGQRNIIVESEREFDRGFLLQGSLDRFEAIFYMFNPDDDFSYSVLSLKAYF